MFGKIFNEGTEFARDGSQFDRLFVDGDDASIGGIPPSPCTCPAIRRPTWPMSIGDAAFVGDTMFMPDYGTARADFPAATRTSSTGRSAG